MSFSSASAGAGPGASTSMGMSLWRPPFITLGGGLVPVFPRGICGSGSHTVLEVKAYESRGLPNALSSSGTQLLSPRGLAGLTHPCTVEGRGCVSISKKAFAGSSSGPDQTAN
uniref:Alternative protein FLT4 n=1 Tax=Homo sapiens TaxID=9606 RepID=L8EBH4_HUMAN|nr:alternative protein FLT4 [Homo sapiens]